MRKGGEVLTRTRATSARRETACGLWKRKISIPAKNIAGNARPRERHRPVGEAVLRRRDDLPSPYGIRLIKGSHIVVPRCIHKSRPTFCKTKINVLSSCPVDGRVFHHRHHRCGIQRRSKAVKIEESEINYLLKVYNATLKNSLAVTISSGPIPVCVRV